MTTSHVGIVWNPSKTSKDDLETAWQEAVSGREGVEVSWFETSEDDPGRAATQQALDAGADVICAAGGDGTVRVVAEHLADTGADVELGIIPLGTGNLLARNLEVPLGDLSAAFARALDARARPVDMGWVEIAGASGPERHGFAVMAGFGIDAHMISETDDDLKDKAGWLAYVESLGRALSASEVIDLRISLDDADPVEEQAHTLLVGNCGALQGGVTLLPDAEPDDGELDLLVLHADGLPGWLDTLKNMVWDNGVKRFLSGNDEAESSATATHRRLTSLTVELSEPRLVEVDGDELGETTRLVISVQPGALAVR